MARVVVVGAGIVGLWAAVDLAERGADVTLVEGGIPGGGLTRTTYGWLNAGFQRTDRDYWQLRTASLLRWLQEHGGATWFHGDGSLHLERAGPELEGLHRWAGVLQRWGEPIDVLEPSEVRLLEPDLAEPGRPALRFRADAWVETDAVVDRLMARLRRAPRADVRAGSPVERLLGPGGPAGVMLASGERLEADHVVVAAARATPGLVADPRVRLAGPVDAGVPGLLVLTTTVAARLGRIIRHEDLVMRPAPGRRLLIQAGREDKALRLDEPIAVTQARVRRILDRVEALLPRHPRPGVERLVTAARALPHDGRPIVGPLDAERRTYVVVTHSGITLAPALAGIVAAELLDGTRDPALDRYLPRAC
jgi:glycine/D-amino acid oxidase-like deaminating enzyme